MYRDEGVSVNANCCSFLVGGGTTWENPAMQEACGGELEVDTKGTGADFLGYMERDLG